MGKLELQVLRCSEPADPAPDRGPRSDPVSALVTRWREQASAYEQDVMPGAAVLRRVADELEEAVRRWALEELTPTEAAKERGCHPSTIRREFPGQKRIRRAEALRRGAGGPDLAGAILRAGGR